MLLRLLPLAGTLLMLAPMAALAADPVAAPATEAIGKGVQIYTCTATTNPAGAGWKLAGPDAVLTDHDGTVIGKHFAGPSWQANDGSIVVGQPLQSSPAPVSGAVPWLVLQAASHSGAGLMANVSYIVRTQTQGGVAPATGCDAAHLGSQTRVAYQATYLFFRH